MVHRPRRSVSWPGKALAALAFTALAVIGGAGPALASPAPGTKLATLKVSGTTYDYGSDVAISGTTAVVAEDNASDSSLGPGKVFVFTKTTAGWRRTATLEASDHAAGDEFGWSVAISGSTIAVGDYWPSSSDHLGRVYIFTKTATGWKQAAKFDDPTPLPWYDQNDQFGWSVATTGNVVYVGSPGYATSFSASMHGSVFVYSKTVTGWRYTARLKPPSSAAYSLGSAVAASGSTVVAGTADCAGPCTTGQTSAYAFTHTSSGWTSARLRSKDLTTADRFGYAVSVSGSEIAVSSPWYSSSSGHVYIFTRTATGWKQAAELKRVNSFGEHIGISGKALVVSTALETPNPLFFYSKTTTGWKYVGKTDLPPGDLGRGGFTPVAVSGPLAAVGDDAGHAYILQS